MYYLCKWTITWGQELWQLYEAQVNFCLRGSHWCAGNVDSFEKLIILLMDGNCVNDESITNIMVSTNVLHNIYFFDDRKALPIVGEHFYFQTCYYI